jgi:DNA polymerase I
MEFIDVLDEMRDPEAVCERLRSMADGPERGDVNPMQLVVNNRVSRSLDNYSQNT